MTAFETKMWALHFDICEMLHTGKATYKELKKQLTGERLYALEYFNTHELTYN